MSDIWTIPQVKFIGPRHMSPIPGSSTHRLSFRADSPGGWNRGEGNRWRTMTLHNPSIAHTHTVTTIRITGACLGLVLQGFVWWIWYHRVTPQKNTGVCPWLHGVPGITEIHGGPMAVLVSQTYVTDLILQIYIADQVLQGYMKDLVSQGTWQAWYTGLHGEPGTPWLHVSFDPINHSDEGENARRSLQCRIWLNRFNGA